MRSFHFCDNRSFADHSNKRTKISIEVRGFACLESLDLKSGAPKLPLVNCSWNMGDPLEEPIGDKVGATGGNCAAQSVLQNFPQIFLQ